MFQKPKSLLSCSLNQHMCVEHFVFGLRAITTSFIIFLTLCLIFKMVDEQFVFFLRKVTSQLISLISTLIDSRELNGKGKKTHFMNTQLLLASLHKKLRFLLQIFLVNMNKSLMEKFIFCALPQDPAVLNVDRKAFMKQLGYNAWLLQFTEFIPYISCLC